MSLLRLNAAWEQLRGSLWFMPALSVSLALVAGTVLATWQPAPGTVLEPLIFQGTPSGARSILSVVSTAMITVTALTFTLTVVALQMASSQYSPRILRGFLADRGNQAVLAIFLGTFVFCLAVLRTVRDESPEVAALVPQAAVTVAMLLTLLSVGALVFFIHHLTQQLRVETVLHEIKDETLRTIREWGSEDREQIRRLDRLPRPPTGAREVEARRSGYIHTISHEALAREAEGHGVVIRLRPTLGSWVTEGTTVAWVWDDGEGVLDLDREEISHLVHAGIHIGPERSGRSDTEFGIRQLVDIAIRALSPSVNDPTTAVSAVGSLTVVLCALAGRGSGSIEITDEERRARAFVPYPTFADYLTLAVGQIRRYGGDEPAVLEALLSLCADVAECAENDDERAGVQRQIDVIEATADARLEGDDRVVLSASLTDARRTLDGARPVDTS